LKPRTKFIIGAGIILATLTWLGWLGATQSKTYYHTLTELSSMKGAERHQRMRVSGYVEPGSIERLSNRVNFVLTEQGKTLPVSYIGTDPLPDTFYEKNAQALVQGRLEPNGHFVAEQVEAKCASKYVAAPSQAQAGPPAGGGAQSPAAAVAH
jgi:cytochrome c-type biogenesis protein CcmE